MSNGMTIAMALDRIAHLTPTYRSPVLKGDGVGVLTPPATLPARLREAQERRTAHYMTTQGPTARTLPDDAPRYVVTSYGALIAWVTLDGRTHYADGMALDADDPTPGRYRARLRHRDAVRAVWPDRMGHDADGEPTPRIPAGKRLTDDGEIVPTDR